MSASWGWWRRLTGEPGPGPGLALAVIALLAAFVAMGGPRELTHRQDAALRQTLASAGAFGLLASDDWALDGGSQHPLAASDIRLMGAVMASYLDPPLVSPAARHWAGMTAPFRPVPHAAPSAVLGAPPVIEIAYRDALAANSRLVSGSFPRSATSVRRAGGPALILQAAVTTATAARFSLRPGSQIALGGSGALFTGDPSLILTVTGIIRPTTPATFFWTQDPTLAQPAAMKQGPVRIWLGGVFVGPAELAALQTAYQGGTVALSWVYPLVTGGLTAGQAPRMLAAMNSLVAGNAGEAAMGALGPTVQVPPELFVVGAGTLSEFIAGADSVDTAEWLLLAGVVAAVAILVLVAGITVAGRYSAELALARARGGSTGQLARRVLRTVAGTAGPALVAGTAAAVAAVPGGEGGLGWVLVALVAAVTLAAAPLLAAWQHRRPRSLAVTGRGELVIGRRSRRRLVAEGATAIVAAGAVLALRLRGLTPGAGVDPYLISVPVLAALAAALIAARLYPLPLRLLLPMAAARRGTVGYLALARSARSRSLPLLPALALVIALTVIALGGLIRTTVSNAQQAASWHKTGADALIQTSGTAPVSDPAVRALAKVPGVRLAYPAYVNAPGSPGGGAAITGSAGARPAGIVVAGQSRYAALVAGTPWPSFPAALLAPPRPGRRRSGPVPVIMSAALASSLRGKGQLALNPGPPIRVAGIVSGTPALPGSQAFVIIPDWAAPRLGASVAPNTVLVMGPGADMTALRATAARELPGSRVLSRASVAQAAANAPLIRGSDQVFDLATAAAAACALAAVLLGLLLKAHDQIRVGSWLTAMGMTTRQSRRLAILDTLPLLLVAILGAEITSLALGPLLGPALVLTPFTGSDTPVSLQPDAAALIAPPAAAIALIIAAAACQNALTQRRTAATARFDEGR